MSKDKDIDELKTKMAEVVATMPPGDMHNISHYNSSLLLTNDRSDNSGATTPPSTLDPNATVYTPKALHD